MTIVIPPTDHQPADMDRQPSRPTPGPHRGPIMLGVLIALVLIAVTVIGVYSANRGPSSPGTPPATTAQPTPQPSTAPTSPTPQESVAIAVIARSFVTEVVGMVDPVAGPVGLRDDSTAAVDFRAVAPNGMPVGGAPTTVLLSRSGASWTAVATVCDAIRVYAPSLGQVVATPLTVSGQAEVYEGTVIVRILEPAGGKLVEVGRGVVTGGGYGVPAPFQGQITFRQPGGGIGWVVFFEDSAANGQVVRATTVSVAFPVRS